MPKTQIDTDLLDWIGELDAQQRSMLADRLGVAGEAPRGRPDGFDALSGARRAAQNRAAGSDAR